MDQCADSTRIRPSFHCRQAYFASKFRIDQRLRDDVRVRDRIFRKKAKAETAREHGQHPIITIAAIDSLAVDATGIEHAPWTGEFDPLSGVILHEQKELMPVAAE